ncbi:MULTISPECIES: hypothetical protein [unclassified Rhizobium]|uniref:hypothetical protein n=1 Tax=unclassified Rhizobium TaxID=2613769 RepID=UPI0017801C1D|nr:MULTISPECIES: hypothetical protein [unclassified Rhizobium]MBD8686595.1 hypothetical protein [Rhizobium sp. CFBP 13644]MBD8691603.1 hypothetical protein [Rhizobium sp. CFBP 13717]
MGARKPILGYPSRTAAVIDMRGKGLSISNIAERLSITSSAVSALEASNTRKETRRAESFGIEGHRAVQLSNEAYRRLRPYAARRDMSVDNLVQMIIENAVTDDLVGAILDDGKN